MLMTSWMEPAAEAVAMAIVCVLASNVALQFILLLAAAKGKVWPPAKPRMVPVWPQSRRRPPGITVIAPAYNEAASIVASVRSLLACGYPDLHVIVVNDGSKDATLQELHAGFGLTPSICVDPGTLKTSPIRAVFTSRYHGNLRVIDKHNGGKADALNVGLNFATTPLVCCVDADSLLEPDALLRTVKPFMDDPERVIAVGAAIRISNGAVIKDSTIQAVRTPRSSLALLQCMEYLRAFLITRAGWESFRLTTLISGAFGLFRHDAVMAAGGYGPNTVGEDLELVIRLHRVHAARGAPYRIAFLPETVCWTQAPEDLRTLGRQRMRWQRGSLETLARHGDMASTMRFGWIGPIGLGAIAFTDLALPLSEVGGLLLYPYFELQHAVAGDYVLAFWSLSIAFGIFFSACALMLNDAEAGRAFNRRDLASLFAAAIIEHFGYRQLNAFWRFQATIEYLRGAQRGWGEMKRKGFGGEATF